MKKAERDRIRRSMELLQKAAPRPVAELIPYERNQKDHPAHQVEQIAVSLRRFGWRQPIVVDARSVIVIGHGRWLAAKSLGLETVPVVDADDLTPDEIRELRIMDNRLNESPWNDFLAEDLQELTFDGFDMGDMIQAAENDAGEDEAQEDRSGGADFFDREDRDGDERQEGNEEYNAFLDKFERKKTTDDCYTPDNIYQAVAEWVARRYSVDPGKFVRPFFPGGDYQNHHYPEGAVVVDNPPFSIMAEIVDFYLERRIPFFLFVPALVAFNYVQRPGVTAVCEFADVTYENKAVVRTSFITSMEGDGVAAFSDPDLLRAINEANKLNQAALTADLPTYSYPDEVLTSARMGFLLEHGQPLTVRRDECALVRALDAQKEAGKSIFGCGLLLSAQKTAERITREAAAMEHAAAAREHQEKDLTHVWKLSDRERALIEQLGRGEGVTP